MIFMVKISAYLKYGTHALNSRANSIYCQQYNNLLTVILKDIELWFILAQFQASEIHFSLPKIMIFFYEGIKCVLDDLFHHILSNQAQNNKKSGGF